MRIVWTALALERLSEIADSIAADRPQAAAEWVEEIFAAVWRLERFAESGRSVPEVRRAEIREIIHGDYRVIYRVEQELVAVLTVRHARQLTGPEDIPST